MALVTKAVKGTQDLLPADSYKNQFIESTMLDIASKFGFREVRTPVFEHTELFQRGVGETTDVVQKEMYTFNDKGERSITLRPEGTAGAVRAFLEGDGFEDTVRRAIAYGGDSDTIASMAGAIAAPFYSGVPEKIIGMCNVYLDSQLRSLMESFENNFLLKKSVCYSALPFALNNLLCLPYCRHKL